jgi:3-oxoacyl-[acyl-carrier protein] reductase
LLAQAGARVIVNFFEDPEGTNRERAEQTVAGIVSAGGEASALAADVSNPAAVEVLFQEIAARYGTLDILINNAGILRDRTARNMSASEWQAVIDTNLSGVFHVCHAAIPHLADGGRIVSMASVSAVVGLFGQANYAAAKAGVMGLTKVLSRELGKRRITVNAVAPGVVEAGMGMVIPEERRQAMLDLIPLGRFASAEEVAGLIVFLCSDLAAYITGQTIHVNGGWWAG